MEASPARASRELTSYSSRTRNLNYFAGNQKPTLSASCSVPGCAGSPPNLSWLLSQSRLNFCINHSECSVCHALPANNVGLFWPHDKSHFNFLIKLRDTANTFRVDEGFGVIEGVVLCGKHYSKMASLVGNNVPVEQWPATFVLALVYRMIQLSLPIGDQLAAAEQAATRTQFSPLPVMSTNWGNLYLNSTPALFGGVFGGTFTLLPREAPTKEAMQAQGSLPWLRSKYDEVWGKVRDYFQLMQRINSSYPPVALYCKMCGYDEVRLGSKHCTRCGNSSFRALTRGDLGYPRDGFEGNAATGEGSARWPAEPDRYVIGGSCLVPMADPQLQPMSAMADEGARSARSSTVAGSASPSSSPEEKLRRLKGLLDNHLISQQDYDEQKRRILDAM